MNEWIRVFISRLQNQGQSSLIYIILGKLFACSPTGTDGVFPHEAIREKIEDIGNNELIDFFALSVLNGRGIHNVTGGKDEYKLGKKYEELSRKLSVMYPKTSKIYQNISRRYFNESKYERKIAESAIY